MTRDEAAAVLEELAGIWGARAAEIERQADPDSQWWRMAYSLRDCARQLRDVIRLLEYCSPPEEGPG